MELRKYIKWISKYFYLIGFKLFALLMTPDMYQCPKDLFSEIRTNSLVSFTLEISVFEF